MRMLWSIEVRSPILPGIGVVSMEAPRKAIDVQGRMHVDLARARTSSCRSIAKSSMPAQIFGWYPKQKS